MAELSQREAYGRALAEYGAANSQVVVLDPDTSSSTLTSFFAKRFPDRFFNIGIAEPCMVDVAVGLALGGYLPFANAFAALVSFRAMEQVRTCVCYARTNVKLVGGYAGVSDFKDGPTHHAITDIATMRALPEMTVIVPADANEIVKWVPVLAEYDGPVYFRLSRSASLPVHAADIVPQIGVAIPLRAGSDLTIIAAGTMVGRSLQAADRLAAEGISARVVEMHTIKPLDTGALVRAAEETGAIVTAEEHTVIGGLGGAVAEALGEFAPVPMERVGIHDTFARTGPDPETLMDAFGLGVDDVVAAARRVIARKRR
jgi:transketolase